MQLSSHGTVSEWTIVHINHENYLARIVGLVAKQQSFSLYIFGRKTLLNGKTTIVGMDVPNLSIPG